MIQIRNNEVVLITGSTGFVCRYVIRELLATTNYNIVVTYVKKKGNYENNDRLFFEKLNLLHPQNFGSIFTTYKIDYVIHLAAMARVVDGENNPEIVILANLVSTIVIAEYCVEYNVKSMVFTSSNLAQDAVSVVGIGKFLIEQYFQKIISNTRFVSFRLPNVIDSNDSVTLVFKKLISENKSITITHPDMSRLFVTPEKASKILIYLMENGVDKGVYVSSERPIKIIDLAVSMIKKSGKKLDVKYIGIKPGEKLVEKYFADDEIMATQVSGLGLIKQYSHSAKNVENAIKILYDKDGVLKNKLIRNIFEEF